MLKKESRVKNEEKTIPGPKRSLAVLKKGKCSILTIQFLKKRTWVVIYCIGTQSELSKQVRFYCFDFSSVIHKSIF